MTLQGRVFSLYFKTTLQYSTECYVEIKWKIKTQTKSKEFQFKSNCFLFTLFLFS